MADDKIRPKHPQAKEKKQPRSHTVSTPNSPTPLVSPTEPRAAIEQWIFRKYGSKGLVSLLVVAALWGVWWHWDRIQGLPGVAAIVQFVSEKPLPKADPTQFSVAIAHLEDDKEGQYEQIIIEALRDLRNIQILRFDRKIPLQGSRPQQSVINGHETARKYLKESAADVLIWGVVLARNGTSRVPKLYWTSARNLKLQRESGRYILTDDINLPKLFWADLAEVLRLLVVTYSVEFSARDGHFIADQLILFTDKVRQLLKNVSRQQASTSN